MSQTILLVDGTNIAMFASFGGKLPPNQSTTSALIAIEYAALKVNARRIVIALDGSTPTFRKRVAQDYKAGRTLNTQPYVDELRQRCTLRHWTTVTVEGFEADDILATLSSALPTRCVIFTSDSDALALVSERVTVLRPKKVRESVKWDTATVQAHYGITPAQMSEYKALVGEKGDNIVGIPGIGPKKAVAMLARGLTTEERFGIAYALHLTMLRHDVPIPMQELNIIDDCTCPMFLHAVDPRTGEPDYVTSHTIGRCTGHGL